MVSKSRRAGRSEIQISPDPIGSENIQGAPKNNEGTRTDVGQQDSKVVEEPAPHTGLPPDGAPTASFTRANNSAFVASYLGEDFRQNPDKSKRLVGLLDRLSSLPGQEALTNELKNILSEVAFVNGGGNLFGTRSTDHIPRAFAIRADSPETQKELAGIVSDIYVLAGLLPETTEVEFLNFAELTANFHTASNAKNTLETSTGAARCVMGFPSSATNGNDDLARLATISIVGGLEESRDNASGGLLIFAGTRAEVTNFIRRDAALERRLIGGRE